MGFVGLGLEEAKKSRYFSDSKTTKS